MLRPAALLLSVAAVLAACAGTAAAKPKTWTVSEWRGSIDVETTVRGATEEIEYPAPGELPHREHDTTDARHRMAGRFAGVQVPRKPGRRGIGLAGGGNLRHWPGTWSTSRVEQSGSTTTYERRCSGVWRNLSRPDESLRLQILPRGPRALRVDVGAHLVARDPQCTGAPGPPEIGPGADGWPEDFTVPLPPAAHRRARMTLAVDHWTWSSACGEHPDRSGTGAVPAPVRFVWRGGECTGSIVTLRRVTLSLRRTCRTRVARRVSASGSTSRCVRKR